MLDTMASIESYHRLSCICQKKLVITDHEERAGSFQSTMVFFPQTKMMHGDTCKLLVLTFLSFSKIKVEFWVGLSSFSG